MKLPDLIGKRFNRLVVLKYLGVKKGCRWWLAVCDCGKQKRVTTNYLTSGSTRSCGCLHREILIDLKQQMDERQAESKRWAKARKEVFDRLKVPRPTAAQGAIPGTVRDRDRKPDVKLRPTKPPKT
jgi:hypothetical protein